MPPGSGEIVETEFCRVVPDCGSNEDYPYSIEFSPAVARMGCKTIKAVYCGGYEHKNIPAAFAAACLELSSWNLNRYRGRLIGVTGNIRGTGKEGGTF